MIENFRSFEAADPFGCTWEIRFQWLQNAIAIRHSDSVDVKFEVSTAGGQAKETVVALTHPFLVALSEKKGRALTDPWCMKLAALHLKQVIESGGDFEKLIITPAMTDLERHAEALEEASAGVK